MIKITNGRAVIGKQKELSKRQLNIVKGLSDLERTQYILSIFGLSKKPMSINRSSVYKRLDKLALKPKNSYAHLMSLVKTNSNTINHKPLSRGNWVGIEIECIIPNERAECESCGGSGNIPIFDDDGNETSNSVHCEGCDGTGIGGSGNLFNDIRRKLTTEKIYRCSVRQDGSITGEGQGVEITILLNTDNGFEPLERLCDVLRNDFNAEVNQTCGLHVHFDFSAHDSSMVLTSGRRVKYCLDALSLLVPESRRNNTFCKLDISKLSGDRYYAINLTSFEKHKSLEIRLHGGTINADKIKNWIELIRIIFKTEISGSCETVQDLLSKLNLNDRLAEYIDERYQKFNKEVVVQSSSTEINISAPTINTFQIRVYYDLGRDHYRNQEDYLDLSFDEHAQSYASGYIDAYNETIWTIAS